MAKRSDYCAALVRAADHDRYLATLFAPAEQRGALYALYAFAAEIAQVRELAREPMPGEIRLQWWREALTGERDEEAAANPVAAALREALVRHDIASDQLVAVIDAHTFDLYNEPMAIPERPRALWRANARRRVRCRRPHAGGAGAGQQILLPPYRHCVDNSWSITRLAAACAAAATFCAARFIAKACGRAGNHFCRNRQPRA